MLTDAALRIDRWLAANARLVAVVTWTVFAIVIADYARFIDLTDAAAREAAAEGQGG